MRRAIALLSLVAGCHSDPVVSCDLAAGAGEPVAADALGVYLDASGPGIEPFAADLLRYLASLWQIQPPSITRGAPDGSRPYAI